MATSDDPELEIYKVLGQGKQSIVFDGLFRGQGVAVKRVDLLNKKSTSNEETILSRLNHLNIVKMLHVQRDPNFKYLVLEKCVGTLDKFWSENLPVDVHYNRPQDGQALLQMAKGLRYIHSQKLVHGDINPNNIMIHYSDEQGVQLKLSDFSHSFIQAQSNLTPEGSVKGIATWLAPELLREDSSTSANYQSDVFSMGCVFAYFLSRGTHPFGENSWIITAKIIKGNHELSKLENKDFNEIIEKMIQLEPNQRPSMDEVCRMLVNLVPNASLDPVEDLTHKPEASGVEEIVKGMNDLPTAQMSSIEKEVSSKIPKSELALKVDEEHVLGTGFQSVVHRGTYKGEPAAIKKVIKSATVVAGREEKALRSLSHLNIIRLLGVDQDAHFKYLALELCAGTIKDYCTGKYQGPMPFEYDALSQMASGLLHIHQHRFIHRDIKPENILISLPSLNGVQLKLSDFGLCKPVTSRDSASVSSVKGNYRWMAPELLPFIDTDDVTTQFGQRQSISTDTFALGCIFYYYLTQGCHPFGNEPWLVMSRIAEGIYDLSGLNDFYLQGIISGMIHFDPFQRTNLASVCVTLQQPVFHQPFVYGAS